MDTDFVKVYDLARDREYIERIQKATVEASELALRTDHGIFGSAKWWSAIRDGTVPTQRAHHAQAHGPEPDDPDSDARSLHRFPSKESARAGQAFCWACRHSTPK